MNLLMTSILFLGVFVNPQIPTTLVFPPFGHCLGIYRAGTEQLAILLGGLIRFNDPQGIACVKLEAWDDSESSADDDELAVYGVNSGTGHIIYNADMYTLGLYGEGHLDSELNSPHGIDANPDGLVLVADTGNERVVILQRAGNRLVFTGTLATDFIEPWDVAMDDAGHIYVTDRSGNALYCFSSLSDTLPVIIELDSPRGLDVIGDEAWFCGNDQFQVVITEDGSRLLRIENGSIICETTLDECGGDFFNYPAIDFRGNVWVTDSIACCVHKFSPTLEYLDTYGSEGDGDQEFQNPTGISVWKRFGQFFIAEQEGARYFWIGSDIRDIVIDTSGNGIEVNGILTETSNVTAKVYFAGSDEIVHIITSGRFPPGEFHIDWNGSGFRGGGNTAGEYRLVLEIEPTYSSRGYFTKIWEETFFLEDTQSNGR